MLCRYWGPRVPTRLSFTRNFVFFIFSLLTSKAICRSSNAAKSRAGSPPSHRLRKLGILLLAMINISGVTMLVFVLPNLEKGRLCRSVLK